MKPLDSLFNLVHSLTENEKKYFRIHASRHVIGNKNNYEKLFDLFCQLPSGKSYDEAQLKKLLKGKSYGKNLAVEKKNLYDLVLVTMRILHAEDTPENQLAATIANLRFLFDKSLHDEAYKELAKALALAVETENLPAHISLYKLKYRLKRSITPEEENKETDSDFEKEKNLLRLLTFERTISHFRRKVYHLYITNKLKPQIPELKVKLVEILSGSASLALTFGSQTSLLAARAFIAEKEGEYEAGIKFYEQMLDLWEQHPLKIHGPNTYVVTLLSNYLVCASHCDRIDVFPDIISKIEQIQTKNIREEAEIFAQAKQHRLVYLLNTESPNSPDDFVSEIETGMAKYASFIPYTQQVHFRFNICLLYLQREKYDKLIDELNKAYTLVGRDEKYNHLLLYLKFFEIMAHIWLKNYDLLSYQFDNLERWLREHQYRNEFTIELVKKMRKLATGNGHTKRNGQLTEVNCPPDMVMLKKIYTRWLKGE